MTNEKYQYMARRTQPEYPNNIQMLINGAMGLCGESGEVCDIIKKYAFQGHELSKFAIINELGDVLWYVALLCDAIDTNISDIMEKNVIKLKTRYPNGKFEAERSRNRTDE